MTAANWWDETRAELAPALGPLRVAFYASAGAPYHHAALVAQWGGVPEPLGAEAIRRGALNHYDVLIMPGGGLRAMGGLLTPLGVSGTAQIHRWVEGGGMYVGSCAGAYLGGRLPGHFLTAHPEAGALHLLDLPVANASEGVLGGLDSPGVGVLDARLNAPEHWLARGLPERFELVHYNGPCFLPPAGASSRGVVTLEAATERFTPWERSLPGSSGELLIDRLQEQRAQLAVAGPCGEGTVILFGSHPEFGFSALQLGWGVGARLFGNALAYQAGRRARGHRERQVEPRARLPLMETSARLSHAAERFAALQATPPDLGDAPAFLGRSAAALWSDALGEASELARGTAAYLRDLAPRQPESGPFSHWADHAPEPDQDYGFVGLAQLAEQIHVLLDRAGAHRHAPPPPQDFPYGAWDRHPYHLLASSYLSAAGLTACASLAAGTLGRLCGLDTPPPHPLLSPTPSSPEGVTA